MFRKGHSSLMQIWAPWAVASDFPFQILLQSLSLVNNIVIWYYYAGEWRKKLGNMRRMRTIFTHMENHGSSLQSTSLFKTFSYLNGSRTSVIHYLHALLLKSNSNIHWHFWDLFYHNIIDIVQNFCDTILSITLRLKEM